MIRNEDQRSKDYGKIAETFRPGHADYTYWQKYGIRDYRGGGRSSARERRCEWPRRPWRVSGWARNMVSSSGLSLSAWAEADRFLKDWTAVNANPFFVADSEVVPELESFMDSLRKSGDSCGAQVTVVAEHVPVGLGSPVYNKLDADLAYAMMGINAVKGVEIGAGFAAVEQRGTEHSDEMTPEGFLSS